MEQKEKKSEQPRLTSQVRERALTYVVAAFSLVASLAWNEAIKSLIDYLFPVGKDTIFVKLLYAGGITLVVVFITLYLERLFRKSNGES